jgi:NAD-dependent SIR2 family protein deacetylase
MPKCLKGQKIVGLCSFVANFSQYFVPLNEALRIENMTSDINKCPKCGGRKPSLMACVDCGYSFLKTKLYRNKEHILTCPKCGLNATKQHIRRCKYKKVEIDIVLSSKELPDWESTRAKNDLFDRGMVFSGGGFGVGKRKRK